LFKSSGIVFAFHTEKELLILALIHSVRNDLWFKVK